MVVAVGCLWLVLSALILALWPRLNTSARLRLGVLALIVALSVVHQLLFGTVVEDAYITFRYAANIAEGHGPVFNIGEPVEGYSNFLWMVLLALAKVLFGADIAGIAVVLGIVCTAGCVVLAYLVVNSLTSERDEAARPAFGLLAALLTAGASGLAAYGPSGMETPLFLSLVLATVYALATRHPVIAGVLVALATMTRPDGVLVAVLAGCWLLIEAARTRSSWWAPAGYVVGALVFAVPWTAWRLTFYHHLLPNAVAAKAGGSLSWQLENGRQYVSEFLVVQQGFLLIAVGGAGLLVWRASAGWARSLTWLVLVIAAGYTGFVTVSGGDWMPGWRMLAPVPPLLAVAAVAAAGLGGVTSGEPRDRVAGRLTALVAIALCAVSLLVSTTDKRMRPAMKAWGADIAEMGEVGDWLGGRLPAGTVVATYANGAMSYRAGKLVVIDVLGLTDEHIARHGVRSEAGRVTSHITTDYAYVVDERRPSVAIAIGGGYTGDQECGIAPEYAENYRAATFRRAGTDGWFTLFLRRGQETALITALDADPRFDYVPCP